MKKIFMLLGTISLFFVACQTSPELTGSEKELLVKSVKEVSDDFFNSFNQIVNEETALKTLFFYSENIDLQWQTDPVFVIYNSNVLANTNDDLEKVLKSVFSARLSNTAVITERNFSVLSNEKVLEIIKMDFSAMLKDSTTVGPIPVMNSIIWTKQDDTWKVQFLHQSDK